MKSTKKTGGRKRSSSELQATAAKEQAKSSAAAAALLLEQKEMETLPTDIANAETQTDAAPKVIMSRAQRRKLKKPATVVTTAMKEKAREEKRELRKYLRMIKSNGSRRKVAKLAEKRRREETENEEALNAFDSDYRLAKRGRRLE